MTLSRADTVWNSGRPYLDCPTYVHKVRNFSLARQAFMWKSPWLKGDASLSGTFSSRKNRNLAGSVVIIMMFCVVVCYFRVCEYLYIITQVSLYHQIAAAVGACGAGGVTVSGSPPAAVLIPQPIGFLF